MPQSLSKVYIHIVFSTKNRIKFISENIHKDVHSYIVKLLSEDGVYTYSIYAYPDHIHILCTLPRLLSISELLNKTKTNSSKFIKSKGIESFSWQHGYGVFSISKNDVEKVSNYIDNQKEHHKKFDFKEEYRKLLKEHNIDFNEKYVWD